MTNSVRRKRLAAQIRSALESDEQRNPSNISELEWTVKQWREEGAGPEDALLNHAYHLFLHFLTDRDIRLRDREYSENQISMMRQLIEDLEGSPDNTAQTM